MRNVKSKASFAGVAAVVSAVAFAASVAQGQQKVTGGTLTAADYVEIQQLVARYAYAVDTHAANGTAYADLFVPDGVFGKTSGRDALTKLALATQADRGGPSYTRHYLTNVIIYPTPEGAQGQPIPPGDRRVRGRQGEQRGARRPLRRPLCADAGGLALQGAAVPPLTNRGATADRQTAGAVALTAARIREGASMRNRILALGIAVGLTGIALAQAQRGGSADATGVMALTAMDYIQIKQLVNRYAFALDTGSRNGYDYADLFTPTGVFHSNTRGRMQGRDQLADLARGAKMGPMQVNHYIVNHIIEPTATGAIGRQYLINISHDDVRAPGAPAGQPVGARRAETGKPRHGGRAVPRTSTRRRPWAGASSRADWCHRSPVPTRCGRAR